MYLVAPQRLSIQAMPPLIHLQTFLTNQPTGGREASKTLTPLWRPPDSRSLTGPQLYVYTFNMLLGILKYAYFTASLYLDRESGLAIVLEDDDAVPRLAGVVAVDVVRHEEVDVDRLASSIDVKDHQKLIQDHSSLILCNTSSIVK